jgi:hypothetical protein
VDQYIYIFRFRLQFTATLKTVPVKFRVRVTVKQIQSYSTVFSIKTERYNSKKEGFPPPVGNFPPPGVKKGLTGTGYTASTPYLMASGSKPRSRVVAACG